MSDHQALSEMEFDVLKEISNIGTGNAATAISKMLEGRVGINVPVIRFLNMGELSDIVGGAEQEVIGILVMLEHDIDGMMMFLMDKSSSITVIKRMIGSCEFEETGVLSEMESSLLTEFGNIIAGSYLSAVSKLTGLNMTASVPALSYDMAGAVLSVPAAEFAKISDKVLLIQSVMTTAENTAEGFFVLIPTHEAFDKIFKQLGLSR